MEILILIVLIVVGLLLFIIELFIIPGTSIAGIASGICLLFCNYYAFTQISTTAGIITILATVLGLGGIIIWLNKSKTIDRFSLKKSLDYKENKITKYNFKVGDKGVAVTRLALVGNADINGNIVEVRSAEGFIDENTLIYIERIVGEEIIVRKRHK